MERTKKQLLTFRLSDEALAVIDEQPGDTRTGRLEYLILKRTWENGSVPEMVPCPDNRCPAHA